MEIIRIERTNNTPSILIDEANMHCKIEGSSFPEDAFEVYQHILDWIQRIKNKDTGKKLVIEFDFDFLNSISHKKVWQIVNDLKEMYNENRDVLVKWYYDENDEDIMEAGEDLSELINVPFELIAKKV